MSLTGAAAATTSVALMSNPTWAQGGAGGREYRRDDLGFRIEMPGEPKVEDKEDDYKDIWIRTIEADVTHEKALFSVHCTEYKDVMSAEQQFSLQYEGMRRGGMPVTRQVPMTMNGFPAREFIRESDDLNYIHRMVVMEKLTMIVGVVGERGMHNDPLVRRFFDSFQLLRSAR